MNDVQPVWVYNEKGERTFHAANGHARVIAVFAVAAHVPDHLQIREVKYRGVVTSALIYNAAPTMDYFRKIDENTILSAADNITKPPETHGTSSLSFLDDTQAVAGTFFFYLTRDAK